MSITPPPMPEQVGHVYPFGSAWVSKEGAYTKAQMQARDSQWIKRIEAEKRLQAVTDNAYAVARERIAALEADRNMLQELLKNLADEFVRVYPIYYYAEPWAHNTNTVLIAARTALEKTK